MSTVKESLNQANPTTIADMFRKVEVGSVLDALRPRTSTFTGLVSAAAQVHDKRSMIFSVEAVAGTPLAPITGGSPGAGEVSIDYDATGLPTFTFAAAVTAYIVNESGDFGDLSALMGADSGAST